MDSPVMRLPRRFQRNFSSRLSVDCYVPVDATLSLDQNIVIVLDHIVPENAHPKSRQLGHLNNLVTLLRKEEESSFPVKVLLCSLRLLLTHDSKEIRTAALRCLRHIVKSRQDIRTFYNERIEYLVVKCLDICMENETERVQAMRLMRHLIALDPHRVPKIMTYSLAAICNSSDDGLRSVCVETVCELAIMNHKSFGDFDVLNLLLHSAMDVEHAERVSEVVFGVILHLLNRMENWHSLDLEYVISPLMEVYFHTPKNGKGLEDEKINNRLARCKMALTTILRSWTGISRLCTTNPCGIRSLINLLCISRSQIQHFIMDLLFEQLFARKPELIDNDFSKSLSSYLEANVHCWTLQQGFVVREGLDLLSTQSDSTFVNHHRSLLLSCLLNTGLCETLVDVATGSKEPEIALEATILLAEVLDLCQTLLPAMYESMSVCASSLLSNSVSSDDLTVKSRARQTVNDLQLHESIKSKHRENISLYLQAVLHQTKSEKPVKHQSRDLESIEPVLRDFQAISPRDSRAWDWDIISMVLESAYDLPKSSEDEGHYRFVRRLVHFFKPSSRFYSIIRMDEDYAHALTVLACQLVVFLAESDNAEAAVILFELLGDIVHCIKEVSKDTVTSDVILSPNRIRTSLSQHYFLLIAHLTHYQCGERYLEKSGLIESLMDLIGLTKHPEYVKLTISALNYGNNPMGKVLLCKALTAACEEGRMYSCQFLGLLMKLKLPCVHEWGMNLLVTQLLDQSSRVSDAALKLLENLCEDQDSLENLVTTLPPLMHLSDRGIFLLAKLVSLPSGFKIFSDAKVLASELNRWNEGMNKEYVRLDEQHRQSAFESNPVIKQAYPLIHLYGQLVQHEDGFDLVTKQDCIGEYIQCLKSASTLNSDADTLALRTSIWALGHIGSSGQGADWLEQEGVLSMLLTLSTCSSNLTVRATAFTAVQLVARTERGRHLVERYGWLSLLHDRSSSSHSASVSSGSGSFSSDFFPDSFRKPLYTVSSCPEVHDHEHEIDIKRDRGQSDSIVHVNHTSNLNVAPRSATLNVSPSADVKTYQRSQSHTPSVFSWPRTSTIQSDPGEISGRPYYRSLSAIVNPDVISNHSFNDQEREAKLYLVEKLSGKKGRNRGFCVPIPVWNLFKLDILKKEIPETVTESTDDVDEVVKRVLQMCGLRGQKTTEHELLKLKQKSPEIFQDERLYEHICELLNEHYFGLSTRRLIQELFLDVDYKTMFNETRAMYEQTRPHFAKSEETIV